VVLSSFIRVYSRNSRAKSAHIILTFVSRMQYNLNSGTSRLELTAMRHLSLVKSLSHLKEEQKYSDEILLESIGLAFTRGTLAEIAGEPSSGKTSLLLSLLSKLTAEGEVCAVVDSSNSFDPRSAVLACVELENLLWVRCGRDMEMAFMAADYLVQAKGFGAVWLNLNGIPTQQLRSVPRTYWYRYRNRVKETPTLLLVTAEEPVTGSASQQSFLFSRERTLWSGSGRFKLLREFHINLHSRKQFYGPIKTKIEADYTDV
jgi:energy-coupling factor transporter ATP-binding protein EcfA2